MLGISCLAVFLSLLNSANGAIGPIASLNIVNKNISPDGFSRPTVLAGGTFPGTTISGHKGDCFRLTVNDHLTDNSMLLSTSIHWHGIFQKGTNWADGAAFVTQCPIAANNSFAYQFTVDQQAGTYWYHSHIGTQYCDGLRGAFIIYDRNDPQAHLYDVDNESTIITLADWYHAPSPGAIASGVPFGSDATLINGIGRFSGGPAVSLAVVNVKQGLRYRLRIIAMSCDPNFTFSIDGHTLTIIETDGVNTEPLDVNIIQILAGQRYSVVLNANRPVGNYWIRAEPNADRGIAGFAGGINSAILRYQGAPKTDPTTVMTPSEIPLVESNLHALTNKAAPGIHVPGAADVLINLNIGFNPAAFQFTLNGNAFVPPTMPVLLQILSGAQTAQSLLPSGSYFALPKNKVIEVSIPGVDASLGGPHPFHLHGHTFYVIRTSDSSTYNFANPVQRDTVNTGSSSSNTTIRFVTDNAGPWFLHCHIDFHLFLGLAVVFAEDLPDVKKDNPVPAEWTKLCPAYDALPPSEQ